MQNDVHVTLVDDDENITTSLAMAYEDEGYRVAIFNDSVEALNFFNTQTTDLIILDIKMPKMDGMELLQNIRKHVTTPVIMLSSKDDEIDQVMGFRFGADDYITKPFSQRLLLERSASLLRRVEYSKANKEGEASQFILGDLVLDFNRFTCFWKNKPIDLTVTEFLLLKCLVEYPGHVKNRNQLMDAAYGNNIYVEDRTIDTHIKRLRQKFKTIDDHFHQIETLYGIGYRFKDLGG